MGSRGRPITWPIGQVGFLNNASMKWYRGYDFRHVGQLILSSWPRWRELATFFWRLCQSEGILPRPPGDTCFVISTADLFNSLRLYSNAKSMLFPFAWISQLNW